jgi:hypothetical protein
VTQGNFFKHSLPWFNEPCWSENKWRQINRWLGLHVTSFLPCPSSSTTLWDEVLKVNPWNQGSLCTRVRSRVACSAKVDPGPKGTNPVDIPLRGAWKLRRAVKNGIPQSWHALVTHVLLQSQPHFPRPHLTEKPYTQDGGTFLQLLPAWLAGLP